MLKVVLAAVVVILSYARCTRPTPYYLYGIKPASPEWFEEIRPKLSKGCGGQTCHEDSVFINDELTFLASKSFKVISDGTMPPQNTYQNRALTEGDRKAILRFYEEQNQILKEFNRGGKKQNSKDIP